MLKRVLGESEESSEVREEDKQSHHSDSIMECRRTPRQHTGKHTLYINTQSTHSLSLSTLKINVLLVSGTPDADPTHRTRSLSPSPPRVRHPLPGQSGDPVAAALSLDDGRQTNVAVSDHLGRRERHHRASHRKHSKVLLKYFI